MDLHQIRCNASGFVLLSFCMVIWVLFVGFYNCHNNINSSAFWGLMNLWMSHSRKINDLPAVSWILMKPSDSSSKLNWRSLLQTQTKLLSYMKTTGLQEDEIRFFFFLRKLDFLHITHRTGPMSSTGMTEVIHTSIFVSHNTSYNRVRPLHNCITEIIQCLIFFNDLFFTVRHKVQNHNTKKWPSPVFTSQQSSWALGSVQTQIAQANPVCI